MFFLSSQDLDSKRNNCAEAKEIEKILTGGPIKSFLRNCATSGKPGDFGKNATRQ